MRLDEFVNRRFSNTLLEAKGHLDHPEDLVFIGGRDGMLRAIQAIQQTAQTPKNITIKWDGYPALIFGRGPDGKFTIMDKHMFNKQNSAVRQLHSPEEWMRYESARGDKQRTGLMNIINNIWAGLEAASTKPGYYWGDLLFSSPLQEQNGLYRFRANPNGITYTVDVDSPIGRLLSNKVAGIAVHQYLDPNAMSTDESKSLDGTVGNLKNAGNVAIVPSAMPQTPRVVIPQTMFTRAQELVNRYADDIDKFFNNAPQAKSAFIGLFATYINNKIVSGNLKKLVTDFYRWVDSRPMTDRMRAKINEYLQQNRRTIIAIFTVWAAIYNLKNSLVKQLDRASKNSPVKGYLQDGTQSQEGFVSQGLKFVNRLGFARQNLSAKRQQPLSEAVDNKQILVIYPGGFHPFHLGHASVFDHLAKKFPDGEVFVAATDSKTERPFGFEDKKFLANQSGVPNDRFVQVKSPYRSEEITKNFDPNNTILVFAVSEKDRDRIGFKPKADGSPSYFQPYKNSSDAPMKQHGYIYVVPKIDFEIDDRVIDSASKIREMYQNADDSKRKQIIADLYPLGRAPKRIKQILDSVLGSSASSEMTEADNPNYFGGSSMSPIPGTPQSLEPKPSAKQQARDRAEQAALQRFMGH